MTKNFLSLLLYTNTFILLKFLNKNNFLSERFQKFAGSLFLKRSLDFTFGSWPAETKVLTVIEEALRTFDWPDTSSLATCSIVHPSAPFLASFINT